MNRKYLAFDIETAKVIPGRVDDLKAHRPLGITCAATLCNEESGPRLWHGKTSDQQPTTQMRQDEAAGLVNYLATMVNDGFSVLTWNGLGFDFDILAEESGMVEVCKQLALSHVDMMFHIFCELGYPIALDRAAKAMGLPGKPATVSGELAPKLWADGRTDEVLNYVAQDVQNTLQLAHICEQVGVIVHTPNNSFWVGWRSK